jgi:hypothetical protein
LTFLFRHRSAAVVNWLSDSIVFLIEAAESITELSHERFHTIGCRSDVAEKGNYTPGINTHTKKSGSRSRAHRDGEREGIAGIIVIILLRYVVEREKTKTPSERASLSVCCALK